MLLQQLLMVSVLLLVGVEFTNGIFFGRQSYSICNDIIRPGTETQYVNGQSTQVQRQGNQAYRQQQSCSHTYYDSCLSQCQRRVKYDRCCHNVYSSCGFFGNDYNRGGDFLGQGVNNIWNSVFPFWSQRGNPSYPGCQSYGR